MCSKDVIIIAVQMSKRKEIEKSDSFKPRKKQKKGKVYQNIAQHFAVKPPTTSLRVARRVTSAFHSITHQMNKLKDSKSPTPAKDKAEKLAALENELTALGGREAYQNASVLATKHFRSSKWVFQLLTKFGLRPKKGEPPLRVFEVGAINRQLLSCHWLNVRAIDLQSRDEQIEQRDFFTVQPERSFAVVVLSMVINCVSDPRQRGDMLRRCFAHLTPGGHLFLMLPLRCLNASPYMTDELFVRALKLVGFDIRERKQTPKIAFFCAQVPQSQSQTLSKPAVSAVEAKTAVAADDAGESDDETEAEAKSGLQSHAMADQDGAGDESDVDNGSSSTAKPRVDRDEDEHSSSSSSAAAASPSGSGSKTIVSREFRYPPRVINKGKGKTCDFAVCFE